MNKAETWDFCASEYDVTAEGITGPCIRKLLELVSILPATAASNTINVIDIAAGAGFLGTILGDAYSQADLLEKLTLLSTDFSPNMVKIAERRFTSRNWPSSKLSSRTLDATNLVDVPSDHFTHAFCTFGIMMIPDYSKALSEMYRVLQPSGIIGITTWQTVGWMPILSEGVVRVKGLSTKDKNSVVPSPVMQSWTDTSYVQKVLEDAGFQNVQMNIFEMSSGSAFSNVLKAKEDLQKSPEQLEQEKRSVISQRIPALNVDGKSKEQLVEQAKQLHNLLHQLHGSIYELSERFERQKYDMVELTERARQIEKGKAKTRKSNIVHTGLGGGLFSGVNDVTSTAPQKVSLFSRYERLTDRRTYKDRRDVWASEKQKADFIAERPKAKIKHNTPPPEENPFYKIKEGGGAAAAATPRPKAAPSAHHEEEEELPPPPAEEEAPAEEAHAEEEPAPAEEEEEEEEE